MTIVTRQRPVTGFRVGISVSESADIGKHGMTAAGINRFTVRLSRALLSEGAVLGFGHDWRNDGIMDAVCGSAIDSFGTPGVDVEAPLVLNLIPWPDSPNIAEDALLRLEGILAIDRAYLPQELAEFEALAKEDPGLHRFLRSRGLTHLRRKLTTRCDARICIGGREHGYSGRFPGVFEEALFSLDADQPTYLAGLLGGITEQLGRAILMGAPPPPDFGATAFLNEEGTPAMAEIYAAWRSKISPGEHPEDCRIDPTAAWESARRLGVERLGHNGLSKAENLDLLETNVEEEAILLIVKGLRRVLERDSDAIA